MDRMLPYGNLSVARLQDNIRKTIWPNFPNLDFPRPAAVYEYFDDFIAPPLDDTTFTDPRFSGVKVDAGAGVTREIALDMVGGGIKLQAAANEDDGMQLQLKGENFYLDIGKELWFEARLAISEATQSDAIIGLCIRDDTLIAGMTDGVYFRTVDGAAAGTFVTEKNSSETISTLITTLVAATWYDIAFCWDGVGVVIPFAKTAALDTWNQGTVHSLTIPNDEILTVSFAYLNGAAAMANHGLSIDFVRVIQLR